MNLYLISQSQVDGYDVFDSAVVAAENEQDAREMHPKDYKKWDSSAQKWYIERHDGSKAYESYFSDWSHVDDVKVEYLGETQHERGVICASFNAG